MSELKFESANHYFKIDRSIAEISDRAISEKALKVYLLHCRRINPTKNMGCSFAGFNDARKFLGIPDKNIYNKAIKELEEKYFIALRPDVKTGYLKTTAIEILNFPMYDAKYKRFKQDNSSEHNHRAYERGQYLSIPSIIIDEGYLKKIDKDTILTLIKLYDKFDYKNFYGVDYRYVHCWNPDFPEGYEISENKRWSKVVKTTNYKTGVSNINCEAINELVYHGLIHYIPALVYQDLDDKEYTYITEVLKRNEEGTCIIRTPKNKGIKAIEILQPEYYTDKYFAAEEEEKG